jgi:AcrR family transcriptional regulator
MTGEPGNVEQEVAATAVPGLRGLESEAAIVDAARDLMAERGLQGLSMRAVAERVGVSATAIYRYFENKDALVRRVVRIGFDRFGEYLRRATEAHPRGSLERVRAIGEAYLSFALEHHAFFRVMFSLQHEQELSLEDLPEGGGYGVLREAVVDAMESGNMRETEPDLMVLYLWSVAHGVFTLSMACKLDRCPEFDHGDASRSPLDLFRAFAPIVVEGIAAGAVSKTNDDDRQSLHN